MRRSSPFCARLPLRLPGAVRTGTTRCQRSSLAPQEVEEPVDPRAPRAAVVQGIVEQGGLRPPIHCHLVRPFKPADSPDVLSGVLPAQPKLESWLRSKGDFNALNDAR